MTTDKIKNIIATAINYDNGLEKKSYEENLQDIYDNQYRYILKVPTSIMFNGIIERFIGGLVTIDLIKSVIVESMEFGGIELEFSDEDWNNLELIDTKLNTEKDFVCEFFEL